MSKVEVKYIQCPSCNGSGYIENDNGQMEFCLSCDNGYLEYYELEKE